MLIAIYTGELNARNKYLGTKQDELTIFHLLMEH